MACTHSWVAHHGIEVPPHDSPAFQFIKGVCLPNCGGFYSVSCDLQSVYPPLTPPATLTVGVQHGLCLHQALGRPREPLSDTSGQVRRTARYLHIGWHTHKLQGLSTHHQTGRTHLLGVSVRLHLVCSSYRSTEVYFHSSCSSHQHFWLSGPGPYHCQ